MAANPKLITTQFQPVLCRHSRENGNPGKLADFSGFTPARE
jgi:hypothetical protein